MKKRSMIFSKTLRMTAQTSKPLVINVFKPARVTSYDVIRHYKKNLPQNFGKIGHFGTLDPFACGVLLIGIGGAARLNDLIHEYLPKTYLAIGKLGVETATGDLTSSVTQQDTSLYLRQEIGSFSKEFIQKQLREKFLGEYMQAPHQYSAAKFMGKKMHEWAREGVEIKKEEVRRFIYSIEVVKYAFPYLSLRVKVSSGTYVRTLFSDMSNYLGTLGCLVSLVRESVGHLDSKNALQKNKWPKERNESFYQHGLDVDAVLPFAHYEFKPFEMKLFSNGVTLEMSRALLIQEGRLKNDYAWMYSDEGKLLGLAQIEENKFKPFINYSAGAV
ncbi:MAG: tRNA pseudouridine synthase B [Bacteriovoracaceae bacterium]